MMNKTPSRPARLSAIACLASVLLATAMASQPVQAAAPMKKTQQGYYRTMIGDYEVTALSDGTNQLPAGELLEGIDKAEIHKDLQEAFLGDTVETSINTYLINTGKKLILIDTGAGDTIDNNSGHLLQSLKAAGYTPAQVDEIYLTHLHLDHAGGLAHKGRRLFPNAIVRVERREADYWLSADNAASAQRGGKKSFTVAVAVLKPYIAAGKFQPFDGDTELSAGISSVASYGHTPGHNAYLVSSRGQRLMIFGDLVHVGAVQFQHPEVTISFDSDEHEAMADRRRTFDAIADQRELVAGAHIPFPGIGHIARAGNAYRWVAQNYAMPH